MSYEAIDRTEWTTFCNDISKAIEGRSVDVDVIGLDVGDQEQSKGLRLDGLTYDSGEDAVHVIMGMEGRVHLDHAIASPKQLYVEIGESGLASLTIIDAAGHEQLVRIREPLALPT